MNEEELRHLHITIPVKTYIDMMKFIQENQSFYRKGDIKRFIVAAIRNQIASGRTHSHNTQFENSPGLTKRRQRLNSMMQQILEFVLQKRGYKLEKGNRLTLTDLKEAISNVTGYHDSQNRSLKKVMKDLVKDGYLTNKGTSNPSVYQILHTGSAEDEFEREPDQIDNQEKNTEAQNEFSETIKQFV